MSDRTQFDYEAAAQVFRVLRARASLYAFVGTLIAIAAVVLATLLVCVHVYGDITFDYIVRAHRENIAIQALDAMPFLFAWWGQYASAKMAREAGSLVESRTGDLEAELAQARYTVQAKTDFFARLSHELRTPINAIVGMSELVMNTDDPAQRRHHAQVIHDSAYGLLSMVNDVLDFSRIEAGRMELDDVGFDLHDHIMGTATLLQQQAEAKGLRLLSLVPPDTPRRVIGDPGRLRQILVNLVGNAIKFTDEGEVVLSVSRSEPLSEGGYRVRIEIADTGPGIAPEEQTNLFEAYQRAGDQRTEGTGLGLSITRELVHAMEGEIGLESEPGQGSVFWFTIQVGIAHTPSHDQPAPLLRGRRALLADADVNRRTALAGQLRTLGLWVTEVDDGIEALDAALAAATGGQPHDLLLCDLFLPRLSGESLGQRLKTNPQTAGICLAVMTATGARGDGKRLNDIGFAGYISLPMPPERLEPFLQAVLATADLAEEQRRRQGLVTRHQFEPGTARKDPVLIVDDSAVNREITLHQLAPLGLTTEEASDGQQALEAMARRRFSAILMDMRLPDMTGDQVIASLREREREHGNRRTPIVVLTAGASDDERSRCEAAGIDAFLTRPVDRDRLRTTLSPLIGRTRADADDDGTPTFTPKLAAVFLQETRQRVDALRTALESEGDLGTVGRHAHTIAGTGRHFPDTGLVDCARRLETLAADGDSAGARAIMPELETAWSSLRQRLEETVGEHDPPPAH